MPIDEKKLQAINTVVADLEKAYGKGTLMQMGKGPIQKIDVIPTGCFSLDYALGIGGIPRGRVTEIYGPESSGKTTLCLHAIAQAQKANGAAAFIDAEHALDLNYAKNLGVKPEELFVSQPDCGEQALEVCEKLVSTNAFDIIVIDSVAALVPRAEIEGDMGDSHMALQARLMSQALRKLTGLIAKSKTSVIFINQLRSKIGVMFGNPETTTGGNALKFYASVRLDIRKIAAIKEGGEGSKVFVGNRTKVKVVKSKVSPPFKETEFDVLYGSGIDIYGDVLDCAVSFGVVKKSGAWLTFGEDRLQGREKMKEVMMRDGMFFEEMKQQVVKIMQDNRLIKVNQIDAPVIAVKE